VGTKRIVITGGPGTGKTSIIQELEKSGHVCLPEISRQVTLDARKQGIEQLFLTQPLLFSQKLLEGRQQQFLDAKSLSNTIVFLDRGLPDVLAYMDYIEDTYPNLFNEVCKTHMYDHVFILPPWEDIYTSDNERYENFEQAVSIHKHLENAYERFGYTPTNVPIGTIEERTNFVLEVAKQL
jgi:predicted ATPase